MSSDSSSFALASGAEHPPLRCELSIVRLQILRCSYKWHSLDKW